MTLKLGCATRPRKATVPMEPSRPRTVTDWRALAAVYRSLLTDMDPERLDELERRHTTTAGKGR